MYNTSLVKMIKLLLPIIIVSASFAGAQETKEVKKPLVETEKLSVQYQNKTYYLGDDITAAGKMVLNQYYPKGYKEGEYNSYLHQRYILTEDDAKTVATKMAKSFEGMGEVTLDHDVLPKISGLVVTESKEGASHATISIFQSFTNGKGVSVRTLHVLAPPMAKEKLEGIVAKLKKKAFTDLADAKFPKMQLPKKPESKE